MMEPVLRLESVLALVVDEGAAEVVDEEPDNSVDVRVRVPASGVVLKVPVGGEPNEVDVGGAALDGVLVV